MSAKQRGKNMKNQNMPANPLISGDIQTQCKIAGTNDVIEVQKMLNGETKYEKAFWQVYSSVMSDPNLVDADAPDMAEYAISAVNAGFKALENRND